MVSALLLYKILQLGVMMLLGFLLVKLKLVKSYESSILSKISLYLLMPSAIINSFNVEMTDEIMSGLALAFAAAIIIHILLLVIDFIFKKTAKGSSVERASVIYSNAANLIIPIVSYVLGEEWVIYSCAFMSVQLAFLWTHGFQLFSDEKVNLKKIFLNVNLIAIVIGAFFMISGIRLPIFVKEITSSFANMLGVVAMIIAGMLATEVNFKKMLAKKRLYLVAFMRLICCPLIVLGVIKFALLFINVPNAEKVLLITFMASMTPAASTVMQFAQLSEKDADFAVAINIVTTILCIVTMPVFVALYQL